MPSWIYDTYFSWPFAQATAMVFNTGYSFLTGVVIPGTSINPLEFLIGGSAIFYAVHWLKKILSEV